MVGHAWIVENGYAMIAKIRQNVIDVEEEAIATDSETKTDDETNNDTVDANDDA